MPDIIKDSGTWVLEPDKDLADLALNVIDLTDGSWTLIDISSQIKSIGFADNANKATLNAVSSGTNVQFSNNAYNSARWWKLLKDSKGVQVNSDDQFIFIATMQGLSSSNPSPLGFAVGTCMHPYNTGSVGQTRQYFAHMSLTNENASGVGRQHEYDCILKLASGGTVSNLLTSSVAQMVQNWGTTNGGGAMSFNNIDGRATSTLSDITASIPLYVQVGMGARQSSYSALEDAEHKQILKYLVIRLDNT